MIVAQEAEQISEEASSGADLLLPAPEELIAGLIAFGIIFRELRIPVKSYEN